MTPINRVKAKKCKACKAPFFPARPMQCVCSPGCAAAQVKAKKAKEAEEAAKAERKQDKVRREALKTRSDYIKEAQREFNRYIRLRDRGTYCISCGTVLALDESIGGGYDCGHFRSVGSAPHLRFDPDNAAGQCKKCNRYGAGRVVEYRKGLIHRRGLAVVERLESDQSTKRYTVAELVGIRSHFKALADELGRVEMLAI